MTGAFDLRETGTAKGIGVFASKQYAEKEVVFEEKPLVSAQYCWNEAYGYYACHHCLKPMESVEENLSRLSASSINVPFPELCPTDKLSHRFCESCGIGYCSECCRRVGEQQYHHLLCTAKMPAIIRLNEMWKQMHYPPETTSITLIARIIATIEGSADPISLIQTLNSFVHDASEECEGLYLLKAENDEKIAQLLEAIKETIPLSHAQAFVTEEGFRSLFALIGRNGQGIGTSVFSEWIKRVENLNLSEEDKGKTDSFIDTAYANMNEHVGTFLNCEGSGLYKLQRCVNHSCQPNARITFPYSDHTLVLEAMRTIETGEEICISYIDDCLLDRSRHTRNKSLKEYYLFTCKCDKCLEQSDQPDVTSDDESEDENGSAEEEMES